MESNKKLVALLVTMVMTVSIFTGCEDKESKNNETKAVLETIAIVEKIAIESPSINLTASSFLSQFNTALQTIGSKLQFNITDTTNNEPYKLHKAIANKNFDIDITTNTRQSNKIESIMITTNNWNTKENIRELRANSLAIVMTLLNLQETDKAVTYFPKKFLVKEFFEDDNNVAVINFNINEVDTNVEISVTRFKAGMCVIKVEPIEVLK